MGNLIEAIQIHKSFRTEAGELNILKDINLSIAEGEMLGIIGASGAGKSTLLHILGALDKPSSGKVLFQGKDVFSLDDSDARRVQKFQHRFRIPVPSSPS